MRCEARWKKRLFPFPQLPVLGRRGLRLEALERVDAPQPRNDVAMVDGRDSGEGKSAVAKSPGAASKVMGGVPVPAFVSMLTSSENSQVYDSQQ